MNKAANVLFPADYFDKGEPDGAMRAEWEAAVAEPRLDALLFDLELLEERGAVRLGHPPVDLALPLVYRGWMMKPRLYRTFHSALVAQGLSPITPPGLYDEFHMFPLAWYRHEGLRACSPRLLAYPGTHVDAAEVSGRFRRFMVKDYVKSAKGTSFPTFFESPVSQERMDGIVDEFLAHRGELLTGGIVCKEYVGLERRGGATNEWRAFYLLGGLLTLMRNSNQPSTSPAPPERLVATFEGLGSPYYTVDFAEVAGGGWIVVETGDGQVSGLATSQDPVTYYQVLADAMGRSRS